MSMQHLLPKQTPHSYSQQEVINMDNQGSEIDNKCKYLITQSQLNTLYLDPLKLLKSNVEDIIQQHWMQGTDGCFMDGDKQTKGNWVLMLVFIQLFKRHQLSMTISLRNWEVRVILIRYHVENIILEQLQFIDKYLSLEKGLQVSQEMVNSQEKDNLIKYNQINV